MQQCCEPVNPLPDYPDYMEPVGKNWPQKLPITIVLELCAAVFALSGLLRESPLRTGLIPPSQEANVSDLKWVTTKFLRLRSYWWEAVTLCLYADPQRWIALSSRNRAKRDWRDDMNPRGCLRSLVSSEYRRNWADEVPVWNRDRIVRFEDLAIDSESVGLSYRNLDFTYAQDLDHEEIILEAKLAFREAQTFRRATENASARRGIWDGISDADRKRLLRRRDNLRWARIKSTGRTAVSPNTALHAMTGWSDLRREQISEGAKLDFGRRTHSPEAPVRYAFRYEGAELEELGRVIRDGLHGLAVEAVTVDMR